jgi:hypothetical protein
MSSIESHSPNTITTPDGQEITNVKKLSGESSFYSSPSVGEIINDGTNDRVLIGYDKDGFGTGEDWGIKVSQAGYDVKTAADNKLIMSSAFNTFKVHMTGTVSLTTSGGSPRSASTTITHNLGYSPVIVGSVTLPAGLSSEVVGFPGTYNVYVDNITHFATRATYGYFAANSNTATITVNEDIATGTYVIRYYVLVETAS